MLFFSCYCVSIPPIAGNQRHKWKHTNQPSRRVSVTVLCMLQYSQACVPEQVSAAVQRPHHSPASSASFLQWKSRTALIIGTGRRALVATTPAQRRVSSEVRSGCSGIYLVWSWELLGMIMGHNPSGWLVPTVGLSQLMSLQCSAQPINISVSTTSKSSSSYQ